MTMSEIRHVVRELVMVAILVAVPAQAPALTGPAAGCQKGLAKGLAKFKKAKIKAWSKCLNGLLKGTGCDTAGRDAAIAGAIDKARAAITSACFVDPLLFNAPPEGIGFAQNCHLEVGALEPYEQGCFGLPVSNASELADCLVCWKEGEIYEWLKILYPASRARCRPDPTSTAARRREAVRRMRLRSGACWRVPRRAPNSFSARRRFSRSA
jgi:hypothetical protein